MATSGPRVRAGQRGHDAVNHGELAVLITALVAVAVTTLGGTVHTGFARATAGFP